MSHTNQPITTPSAQPLEELSAQLESAQARAQQIEGQRDAAAQKLETARAALVDGNGSTSELTSAQGEFDALQSAFALSGERIEKQRAEVEAAQSHELRALQIAEAGARASLFLTLRGEVEKDAARLVELLESEGAKITARIDAASDAARDFRLCHQAIDNPPDAFETSDGQSVTASQIDSDSDSAANILAWLYRRATENHAAREAFEALYKGARRDQETQWLRSFHDRSIATALNPDPAQMARNVAATRAPAQPLNQEQQREFEARQWRLNQDSRENGGRARMEGTPGATMMDAIEAEAQAARIAAETRARAELEGAFV